MQAPFAAIVKALSGSSAISNVRLAFTGARRSSTDEEGVFLVARSNVQNSVGLICQLGAYLPANNVQRHEYMVRRNASDASGNEIVALRPGTALTMKNHFLFTAEADLFTPPAAGTQLSRAAMHVDQLAPLLADPAREVVYSAEPQPPRGGTLLRQYGTPITSIVVPCS